MSFDRIRGAKRTSFLQTSCIVAAVLSLPLAASAQTPPPVRTAQTQAVKPKAAAPAAQPAAPAVTQGVASAKPGSDNIIARDGTMSISADDVRAYLAGLGARERAALSQDPSLLSQAVRMMLANRLVLQEALTKKWDQQPNVVEQLQRIRESAVAQLYMQSLSTPPANFPSEDDLQKVYDANRNSFLVPRRFQLAQIFVPLAKDADKAAEDKAKASLDDIQRKLKAPGADFGVIANETGETKNGGDLGSLAEAQLRPEIRTPIMALPKNGVSEPIKLDDGWHIVKLFDTTPSYTAKLSDVRDTLVQQMRNERAEAMRRAYIAELLKQHPPAINEMALSLLVSDQPPSIK